MEFRLTYQGPILSDQLRDGRVQPSRAQHKQQIRKMFHPQLKRLWDDSPFLGVKRSSRPGGLVFGQQSDDYTVNNIANRFSQFGYRFVPLAMKDLELLCSVEILFLRYGNPGDLFNRTGDIDNRLKALLMRCRCPAMRSS
jgi:UDP:flavonoid glycosyltransferase YjiC (YdhE family)